MIVALDRTKRTILTRITHVESLLPVARVPYGVALVSPPLVHEDKVARVTFGRVRAQGEMIEAASTKYAALFVEGEKDEVRIGQRRIVMHNAKRL
jgi:hypothetical protein